MEKRFTGATNNSPTRACPVFDRYSDEDIHFCIGCLFLKRTPEKDLGTLTQAHVCEIGCMYPDVLYQDYEPLDVREK